MKKRTYRRTAINNFDPAMVQKQQIGGRLILAIDVAKQDMVAALTTDRAEVLATLSWKHLEQTPVLLEKLKQRKSLGFALEHRVGAARPLVKERAPVRRREQFRYGAFGSPHHLWRP